MNYDHPFLSQYFISNSVIALAQFVEPAQLPLQGFRIDIIEILR